MTLTLTIPEADPNSRAESRPDRVKSWLRRLPQLEDPSEQIRGITDEVAALNRTSLDGKRRLDLLELYYEAALPLIRNREDCFRNCALPLTNEARNAARSVQNCLTELCYGYKIIVLGIDAALFSFGTPRQLVVAIVRAISCITAQLAVSYRTYAPTVPGTWFELHQLAGFASAEGVDNEKVLDFPRSCGELYRDALLLASADPLRLLPGEVDATSEYLGLNGNAVRLSRRARENDDGHQLFVNQRSDGPAVPKERAAENATGLVLDVAPLSERLRGQIAMLVTGSPPEEIGLPLRARDPAFLDLLSRLARLWAAPKERLHRRHTVHVRVELAIGLRGVWLYLGQTSEGNEPRMKARTAETGPLQHERYAEQLSDWMVINEGTGGFGVMHISGGFMPVRVGDLVALRRAKSRQWDVGVIRRVMSDNPDHLELGVQRFAPGASRVAANPALGSGVWLPAIIIPASNALRQPMLMIVERGQFGPGREMTLDDMQNQRTGRVIRLAEQTASLDFCEIETTDTAGTATSA